LDQSFSSAVGLRKGAKVLITKQASGYAKIDPLMAAFAAHLMSLNPTVSVATALRHAILARGGFA
jgi:phage terminase large subunit-like protein